MCLPQYQHHQRSGTRETRDSLAWRATAPYKYMLFQTSHQKTTFITNPRWKVSSFAWINNLVEDLSQVHDCSEIELSHQKKEHCFLSMKVTGSFIGIVMVSEKKTHNCQKRRSQFCALRAPLPTLDFSQTTAFGLSHAPSSAAACAGGLCSAAGCVGSADGCVSNCGTALVAASKRRSLFSTQESWPRTHRHQFALLMWLLKRLVAFKLFNHFQRRMRLWLFLSVKGANLRWSMILEACIRALSCVFRSFIIDKVGTSELYLNGV